MYEFDFNFFLQELWVAVKYIPVTLLLSVVPMFVGLVFGSLLAVGRIQKIRILSPLTNVYVILIRGIPMVLLLLVVYFGFNYGFNAFSRTFHLGIESSKVPIIIIAIFVLCIISIAFLTESVRAALQSVPKGQVEAAYSVGMTTCDTYRRVIIPQALPVAVPILGNMFISFVKGSALVYMIGVVDLLDATKIEANINYRYLEAYIAAAIVYWAICVLIEKGTSLLSKRVNSFLKG
jgi:L-cystine transport system permease protein